MESTLGLLTCGFMFMIYISSAQAKDFLLEERLINEVQDLLNKLDNEDQPEKRTETEVTYNAFMNEMKGLVAAAVGEHIDPVTQSAEQLKADVKRYSSNSWLSKRSLDEQEVGVQGADSNNSPDLITSQQLSYEKKGADGMTSNNCYARSSDNGRLYSGTVHKTISNRDCQRWDSQTPHTHTYVSSTFPEETLSDAENYCRNPSSGLRPWCYTTDSNKRWEYCHVYPCGGTYQTNTLKQLMSSTEARIDELLAEIPTLESQITAMENTAQAQSRKPAVTSSCTSIGKGYGDYAGCPSSYAVTQVCGSGRYKDCSGGYSHWVKCCQIQSKVTSYGCYAPSSDNGRKYRGTVHKTINDKTCQRWDSQTPHTHTYVPSTFPEETLSDAENYCRNPSSALRPWCYTTDSNKRWEYCNVYPCGESIDIIYSDCETIRKGYGSIAECSAGKYMVGTCGSGNNLDCGNWASHYAHCCKLTGGRSIGSCESWKYGLYGAVLKCSGQQVATGYCGSGSYGDCPGWDHYTGIRCCNIA